MTVVAVIVAVAVAVVAVVIAVFVNFQIVILVSLLLNVFCFQMQISSNDKFTVKINTLYNSFVLSKLTT